MNIETIASGYMLQVNYPVEAGRNKSYIFRDASLLNARQSAFHKVQQVAAEKQEHEVLDMQVQLVGISRTTVGGKHRTIAAVYSQRLNRTMFMQDGKDLLRDMQLDAFTKKSLPASLFLTIGLEQSQQTGNSLEVVEKTLTPEEISYYQENGYSISF